MILNIRGGLGTQVLELLVGLAKARLKNEIVDEICINTGGNVVSTVKHNYISELFSISIPVTVSDGTLKQNAWTSENFELISDFQYFEPKHGLRLKPYIEKVVANPENDVIFHVRGKDRPVAHFEDYKLLINDYQQFADERVDIHLLGDDSDLVNKLCAVTKLTNISSDDPVLDWITCLSSSLLVGGFSSFSLSAALFKRHGYYSMLGKENCTGEHLDQKYWDCVDVLMKKRERWTWV